MQRFFTYMLLFFSLISFGQRMTFDDWENLSKQNNRLLPKYGGIEKTPDQKKSDSAFIKDVMEKFQTEREASDHMIDLGFKYLYRGDFKTAMYRFNQAYLLDNANENIYWGYGGIYMAFGEFDRCRKQYEDGLKTNPKNAEILVDYGTSYLGEYYQHLKRDPKLAKEKLDRAIAKLREAYGYKPENANASYKLAICYMYQDDCENANSYLAISEKLKNPQITDDFRTELKQKCSSVDLDCSSIKTGSFKTQDELSGLTIIERTDAYQIEENKEHGHKLKFEVTWLDECTYQLKPIEDLLNPENKKLPTMILTCQIIEINENGYTQISSSDTDNFKLTSEVLLVQ